MHLGNTFSESNMADSSLIIIVDSIFGICFDISFDYL